MAPQRTSRPDDESTDSSRGEQVGVLGPSWARTKAFVPQRSGSVGQALSGRVGPVRLKPDLRASHRLDSLTFVLEARRPGVVGWPPGESLSLRLTTRWELYWAA